MSRDLLCYGCNRTTPNFGDSGDEQPQCPLCGSEFVEFREPDPQPVGSGPAGTSSDGISQPINTMQLLSNLMSAFSQGGAQIMVQGPSGVGGPFNFGDFGVGSMEDIMTHIMEQHQPQNHPTSPEVRDNLPKRKVPRSASHKGDEEYAVGANCKAGDPCSICHTEFAADEKVSQLPCEHCFHDSCIKPWLEVQNTCPICRAVLPGTEARAESSGATGGQQQSGAPGMGPLPQGQNPIDINEFTQNLFGGPNIFGAAGGFLGSGMQFNGAQAQGAGRGTGNRNRVQRQTTSSSSAARPPAGSTAPSSNVQQQSSGRSSSTSPSAGQGQEPGLGATPGSEEQFNPVNWLTGEGTPGGRHFDMSDIMQLQSAFSEFLEAGIAGQDSDGEDSDASSTTTGSVGDHASTHGTGDLADEEDETNSESASLHVHPGSDSVPPVSEPFVRRDSQAGNTSIDEVIPPVMSGPTGLRGENSALLNKADQHPAADDTTADVPSSSPGTSPDPANPCTDQGGVVANRQESRDPYRIGFAGPPRMDSIVRSNSSDPEASTGEHSGEGGGLGIFTPIGWLARGAMQLGGNVLGRRH